MFNPKAKIALVAANPMDAVIEATRLRRAGISVITQLSGNVKRQTKRGHELAEQVVFVEPANPDNDMMKEIFG